MYGKTRRLHGPFSAWKDVPLIPRHLTSGSLLRRRSGALTELGSMSSTRTSTSSAQWRVRGDQPASVSFPESSRLRELGKPFVVIIPCSTLTTRYFRDLFPDIQVIVPRGASVQEAGGRRGGAERAVQLRCLYFCWRLGLPRDVVFLTMAVSTLPSK